MFYFFANHRLKEKLKRKVESKSFQSVPYVDIEAADCSLGSDSQNRWFLSPWFDFHCRGCMVFDVRKQDFLALVLMLVNRSRPIIHGFPTLRVGPEWGSLVTEHFDLDRSSEVAGPSSQLCLMLWAEAGGSILRDFRKWSSKCLFSYYLVFHVVLWLFPRSTFYLYNEDCHN